MVDEPGNATTPRAYRMRKRNEDIANTRRRITEAAVQLHGTVGPAQTTFSAVAELAGVQRSTVYRHFADEEALFGACTSHWLAQNPWPRVEDWKAIGDPRERLEFGLGQLYRYFERNEQMLANSFRDIEVMPAFVAELMRSQVEALRDALLKPWQTAGADPGSVAAALAMAIDFRAWQAMRDAGWAPGEAAANMTTMVGALTR